PDAGADTRRAEPWPSWSPGPPGEQGTDPEPVLFSKRALSQVRLCERAIRCDAGPGPSRWSRPHARGEQFLPSGQPLTLHLERGKDRKSTRLNSSHVSNSYAVFCFK